MNTPRVVAFIAVRNEAASLSRTLPHLACNGVRVALLDNGSDREQREALEAHLQAGLVETIVDLPWSGSFDLGAQLAAKAQMVATSDADWVMHLDADEMPHSPHEGETLVDAIVRADAAGCNVLNFEEFVFLPLAPLADDPGEGFFPFQHYYFFEPRPLRLMRAWRPDAGLNNEATGGHSLEGDGQRVFPEFQVLRHYPFLSQEHAWSKYTRRRFHPTDLARGWHGNRVGFEREAFTFPPLAALECLDRIDQRQMNRSRPRVKHYWDGRRPGNEDRAGTDEPQRPSGLRL